MNILSRGAFGLLRACPARLSCFAESQTLIFTSAFSFDKLRYSPELVSVSPQYLIFLSHLRKPDTGGKENSNGLANGEGSAKPPLRKTAINPFFLKSKPAEDEKEESNSQDDKKKNDVTT